MIVFILLFITCALAFIWAKRENRHFYMLAEKIPGPPTVPILGNTLTMLNNSDGALDYFVKASKEYGPVTGHWLGSNFYVFLTDPDDVEIILKDTENLRKAKLYDFYEPWVGNALLRSTGDVWRHHRKCVVSTFHLKNLEQFVTVFQEKGKILINKLAKHLDGEPFDINPYIESYTLDAVMATGMGLNINVQDEEQPDYVKAMNRLLEITNTRTWNPLLHSDIVFKNTQLGKDYYSRLDYLQEYTKEVLDARKKNLVCSDENNGIGNKQTCFLDLVLNGQKIGNGFSDYEILDELNNFLFSGQDTSTALVFTIYNLAKYPEIQERLYEDIIEQFGDDHNTLTLKQLQRVKYLEMVINESLRLFPTAPALTRELDTDLKLTNYTIPAGTSLTCFSYMLMRNEKYFPDPEVFDPERFSSENSKGMHPFAHIPFSAGPRNCVGQKYAMLKLKSVIISILKEYKINYVQDVKSMENNIVLTAIGGILVRLEKRK